MALDIQSVRVRSTGGVWSTLASGPLNCTSVEAASVGTACAVGLRLARAGTYTYIVPLDELPAGVGTKIRIPMLPLVAGDSLEVMSEADVNWELQGTAIISPRQFTAPLRTGGGTWTNIVTSAGQVMAFTATNVGLLVAEVSVQVVTATGSALLVPPELIPAGASRRKVPVTTLAVGDVLQVRSTGAVDWLATGVNAS